MDVSATASPTSSHLSIQIRDGVRAILEHSQFAVTPVPIETNRDLAVPVDFVAETNGQRFVVKCLENPAAFGTENLHALVKFSSSQEISNVMIVGDGDFVTEVESLAKELNVRLTNRDSYQQALAGLPQSTVQNLIPATETEPASPKIKVKTAFDEVPSPPALPPLPPSFPSQEMANHSPAPAGYGTYSGGTPRISHRREPKPWQKAVFAGLGAIVILGVVGIFAAIFVPKAPTLSEDEQRNRDAQEQALGVNHATADLRKQVETAILDTRKSSGLETAPFELNKINQLMTMIGSHETKIEEISEIQFQTFQKRTDPTFQVTTSELFKAETPDELITQVKAWAPLKNPDDSNFGTVTRTEPNGRVWTWIFNGKRISREQLLDEALRKGGVFSLECRRRRQ